MKNIVFIKVMFVFVAVQYSVPRAHTVYCDDTVVATSKKLDMNRSDNVLSKNTNGFEIGIYPTRKEFRAGEDVEFDFVINKGRVRNIQLANPYLESQWPCAVAISVFGESNDFLGWIKAPDVSVSSESFPPPESSLNVDRAYSWISRIKVQSRAADGDCAKLFRNPGNYKVLVVASVRLTRGNENILDSDSRYVQYAKEWASEKLDRELCRSSVIDVRISENGDNTAQNATGDLVVFDEAVRNGRLTCALSSVKRSADERGRAFYDIQVVLANGSNQVAYLQNWNRRDSEPVFSPLSLPVRDQQGQLLGDFSRMHEYGKNRFTLLRVARLPPKSAIVDRILIPCDSAPILPGKWSVHVDYENTMLISEEDAMRVLRTQEARSRLFPAAPTHRIFVKSEGQFLEKNP